MTIEQARKPTDRDAERAAVELYRRIFPDWAEESISSMLRDCEEYGIDGNFAILLEEKLRERFRYVSIIYKRACDGSKFPDCIELDAYKDWTKSSEDGDLELRWPVETSPCRVRADAFLLAFGGAS